MIKRFCKKTGQVKKVRDSLSKTKRKSGKDCLLYQGHDVTTAKWCVLGNASSYRNIMGYGTAWGGRFICTEDISRVRPPDTPPEAEI